MKHQVSEPAAEYYDLEERLLDYAARIIRLSDSILPSPGARHIADQLVRSGTAPLANHGEAQAAESAADFVHKLKISLKELRETYRWLRLVEKVPLVKQPERIANLLAETDELIAIFATSIKTAARNSTARKP
jgi:four helix bundle protein